MNDKKLDMLIGMLCSVSAQLDELLDKCPGQRRKGPPGPRNFSQEERIALHEAKHRFFRFGEMEMPDELNEREQAEFLLGLDDRWKEQDERMRSGIYPKSAKRARRSGRA